MHCEKDSDSHGCGLKLSGADNTFMIGSFLDVPLGQDINSSDSLEVVLEFLKRNRFTTAEAALRGELTNRPDLNYSIYVSQEKDVAREISQEFIVKEMEAGGTGNGSRRHKGIGSCWDLYPWSLSSIDNDCNSNTKESVLKTVFPFSSGSASSSSYSDDKKEMMKQNEEQKGNMRFDLPLVENHREELPRLPPVKIKSENKLVDMHCEKDSDSHECGPKLSGADNTFMIGSFLDVPLGQDIKSSVVSCDENHCVMMEGLGAFYYLLKKVGFYGGL